MPLMSPRVGVLVLPLPSPRLVFIYSHNFFFYYFLKHFYFLVRLFSIRNL